MERVERVREGRDSDSEGWRETECEREKRGRGREQGENDRERWRRTERLKRARQTEWKITKV